MNNSLKVQIHDNESGNIVIEENEYIYSYQTEDKNNFISLTMPVRKKPYIHNKLLPIFEMHLPEGYLLSIIKKHFSKIVKTDDFGLLKIMSHSINGRLTYQNEEKKQLESLTLNDLIHPKSNNLFDELIDKFALSSALSGVQPKVLARVENRATLKLDEYIVKSWGEEYPQLALNEYYCMKVVQHANIPVSEFYLSDDDKLFIMKRFDILDTGNVLGFEDMCVLQAKQRDDKYNGSYEQIAKTIKTFTSNRKKKISLINFYKMIVINYLLQNGDAHLKNFGLLYDGYENIWLAPSYDVICTTIYINNDVPALNLLGSKKWWDKKFILKFGQESCQLTNKESNDYFNECLIAITKVVYMIEERLKYENNSQKTEVLRKLLDVIRG